MKKYRHSPALLTGLLVLIFIGCTSNPQQNASKMAPASFYAFLKKFKPLTFPVVMKTGNIFRDSTRELDTSEFKLIKYSYEGSPVYAYGILPDTSKFYKVIVLEPADDYFPVLATFTKKGNLIDQKEIIVGGCGVDCGFSCNETTTIKRDLSIYSVDSERYAPCDSNGNNNNKPAERDIRYLTGKISSKGRIHISGINKQDIK